MVKWFSVELYFCKRISTKKIKTHSIIFSKQWYEQTSKKTLVLWIQPFAPKSKKNGGNSKTENPSKYILS